MQKKSKIAKKHIDSIIIDLARVHFDCYTLDGRRLPVGPADYDLTDCFFSLHGLARDLHRPQCDSDVRRVLALVRLLGRFSAHWPDVSVCCA